MSGSDKKMATVVCGAMTCGGRVFAAG